MGILGDIVDRVTGKDQADQAKKASKASLEYQQKAADLIGEEFGVTDPMREDALGKLAGLYGLEGGTGSQQDLIDYAQNSPLYAAITGTREAGEDAIMRNAAATGGLRSGNVQQNMYDYNQRLDERALLESYNQQVGGLEGFGSMQGGAMPMANALIGQGNTVAQGQLAAGNARAQGTQNMMNLGAMIAFSDRRLKEDVEFLGNIDGHNIYEWRWNDEAKGLGIDEDWGVGVMADEVEQTHPEVIGLSRGYKTVNYAQLGI